MKIAPFAGSHRHIVMEELLMAATLTPTNISNLLSVEEEYPAPKIVVDQVQNRNWKEDNERSIKDPEGFWEDEALKFTWTKPWTKVLDWDGVHHKWFLGAKTNITINALDRHANSDRSEEHTSELQSLRHLV